MHWSPNTVTGQVKGAIPVTYWYIKDPRWSWHPLLNRNAVKCNRAYESLQDLIKFVSDSVDPVWIQRSYLCNKLTRCQSWWILGPHLCTEIQAFLRLCVYRNPGPQESRWSGKIWKKLTNSSSSKILSLLGIQRPHRLTVSQKERSEVNFNEC